MTLKHTPATPLPFYTTMPAQHGGKYIRGFDGTNVAALGLDINHKDAAIAQNAAYIAHAANAYPQLVEALRLTNALCDEHGHAGKTARALLRELGEL